MVLLGKTAGERAEQARLVALRHRALGPGGTRRGQRLIAPAGGELRQRELRPPARRDRRQLVEIADYGRAGSPPRPKAAPRPSAAAPLRPASRDS